MTMNDSVETVIERVAARLREAPRVLAITGAGISADSGLPTYRGVGGLYEDEHTEDAVPIEEALSGDTFERDPALTWKHIGEIEAACRGAGHNEAHTVLAKLESVCRHVCVLTQNVDGFHSDAGSSDVIEMHGNLHELHCTRCRFAERVSDFSDLRELPPRCLDCGGVIRPRVVLFGEMLPADAVARYETALTTGFDLVMAIGTTAVFPYIAAPVSIAARSGVPTVEINPTESEVSRLVEDRIPLGAADALSRIWRRLDTAG